MVSERHANGAAFGVAARTSLCANTGYATLGERLARAFACAPHHPR